MTYDTHLYLGTLLYPVIRENWNVELNRKSFLYGCIKPDICSLFFSHPHFYRISKKFFFKKIRKLMKKKIKVGKKNKKFSEDLGIILHYTADFFTSVHNIVPNKLKEHIIFEKRLATDFLLTLTEETVREYFFFTKECKNNDVDIKEEINRLHQENRCSLNSTKYDIKEILTSCVTVSCRIMDAVQANMAQSDSTSFTQETVISSAS